MNRSYTQALTRFIHVPAEFARYEVDLDWAAKIMAVTPDRLAELAANGLPHQEDPRRGPLFDYVDLINLGMFGGQSGQSVPELAARYMLRYATADPATWYQPREWVVRVRPPDAERVSVSQPDLTAPGVQPLQPLDGDPPGYRVAVRITGCFGAIRDNAAAAIYADVLAGLNTGTVTYQAVPEALRMRHLEAWKLGMADCVVLARLLAERLRYAGFTARARRGYLLGLIGSDHAWCELHEAGSWKPLDPVFAHLARDRTAFAAACAGGRFNRFLPCVVQDAAALMHVDGEPARPWVLAGVSSHAWRNDG